MKTTKSRLNTTQDVYQLATGSLVRLIRRLESGDDPSDDFPVVRQLLESLPMATGEFGLATNRLKNARRYLQSREPGGARWELAALLDSLRRENDSEITDSRPRRRRSSKLNDNIDLSDDGDSKPLVIGSLVVLVIIGVCVAFNCL